MGQQEQLEIESDIRFNTQLSAKTVIRFCGISVSYEISSIRELFVMWKGDSPLFAGGKSVFLITVNWWLM